MICKNCGNKLRDGAKFCTECGMVVENISKVEHTSNDNRSMLSQNHEDYLLSDKNNLQMKEKACISENFEYAKKSKNIAGLLAIFLGGVGAHKFYMGNTKMGILYLIFCWTYIPSLIAFVEGIIYLCGSDEKFMSKCFREKRYGIQDK